MLTSANVFKYTVILISLALLCVSCADDNNPYTPPEPPVDPQAPVINQMVPDSGAPGSIIMLYGYNFSYDITAINVSFGSQSAVVNASKPYEISVTVPRGITTGPIEVKIDGHIGTSQTDFTALFEPISYQGSTGPWTDIVWTGNRFVASGDHGAILTSQNGLDWTTLQAPTAGSLWSIAHNPTGIVAVGEDGAIVFSETGEHWTLQSAPAGVNGNLVSVAASPGRFVAVPSQGNYILSSANGRSWQKHDLDSTWTMSHVAYDGRFVAFVNRAWLLASSDGLTWTTTPTLLVEPPVQNSAWSGRYLIITKRSAMFRRMSETTWSDDTPSSSLMAEFSDITWDGTRFITVGDGAVITAPANGRWSKYARLGLSSSFPPRIAANENVCVVVGGYGSRVLVWQRS